MKDRIKIEGEKMKVYIVQNTRTMIIVGCFKHKKAAEKYILDSDNYAILECKVCMRGEK